MRRLTSGLILAGALAALAGCGGSTDTDINRLETQVEQLDGRIVEVQAQIEDLSEAMGESGEQTTTDREKTARGLTLLKKNTLALQSGLHDVAFQMMCGYPPPAEGAGAGTCHVPCGAVAAVCTDAETGEFLGDER